MFLEKVWSLDCRSSIGIEILNFLEFLFTIPLLTFYILYLICCISYILYILVLFISILFIILYSLIFHILYSLYFILFRGSLTISSNYFHLKKLF